MRSAGEEVACCACTAQARKAVYIMPTSMRPSLEWKEEGICWCRRWETYLSLFCWFLEACCLYIYALPSLPCVHSLLPCSLTFMVNIFSPTTPCCYAILLAALLQAGGECSICGDLCFDQAREETHFFTTLTHTPAPPHRTPGTRTARVHFTLALAGARLGAVTCLRLPHLAACSPPPLPCLL